MQTSNFFFAVCVAVILGIFLSACGGGISRPQPKLTCSQQYKRDIANCEDYSCLGSCPTTGWIAKSCVRGLQQNCRSCFSRAKANNARCFDPAPKTFTPKLPNCKANPRCLVYLTTDIKYITAADMQAMIDDGADVNAKRDNGWTPLLTAAFWGSVEVIPVLVKAGADVNAKRDNGWTPLHLAAVIGNAEVISVLVKAGADVNAEESVGGTPLDVAKLKKHWNVVRALEDAGGKCNLTC